MAKVASASGAEEALATLDNAPARKSIRKPEAFVMSGDVLISLNRNVSSTYAKLLGDQLPPNTEIHSSTPPQQLSRTSASAGVAFPSMNRSSSKKLSRLPVSTSQPDGVRRVQDRSSESPSAIRMHKPAPIEKPEEDIEIDGNGDNEMHNLITTDELMRNEEKENEEMKNINPTVAENEQLIGMEGNMNSPNEEIVNKSLRSAMFAMPAGSSSFYSSPQINDSKSYDHGDSPSSPVYDDVDECDYSRSPNQDSKISANNISGRSETIENGNMSNLKNGTPTKRSVVTIDASHSPYEPDDLSTAYFTTCETPIRSVPPLRKQVLKNQNTAGTSSTASNSPSLHADNRNESIRSDSNVVFPTSNVASTSNNTVNSIGQNGSIYEANAAHLARKLYELKGCTPVDVADKLNEQSESAFLVLVKYLEIFQFSTTRIDAALREFLSRVELRGESSQRERLLRVFSARYLECNPSIFESLDDVHTLTCALLLLNSDLHGPNNGKKMSARDFITNIGHTGCTFKREVLKTLYQSIKDNAISLQQGSTKTSTRTGSISSRQNQQCLYEVDPNSVVEYYSGFLMRKYVREADGAKTPFGRRSWKMVYARLRGLVLYFDSDEIPKATSRYASLENAVSLHHSLAEPAADYKKKSFVIRVRIAHGGEILFQTGNERDMNEWCAKINFVAAAFSSPTLPLPVTSKPESAPMPRLPRIPCLAPIGRQIMSHEARMKELNSMIDTVAATVYPERPQQQILDRLVLLHFEKRRYVAYINILSKHSEEYRKTSSATVNTISSPKKSHKTSSIPICEDRMSYTDAVNGCN